MTTRRSLLLAPAALALAACARGTAPTQEATPVPFPSVSASGRAGRRLAVLRQQYQQQPGRSSFTSVADEPWCADFVSWVERASGRALVNPNSGGWRIPGTMTLLDVLRSEGTWHSRSGGFVPAADDIAIYDGNGPFGQHTNYVLGLSGGRLTTIGGNEPGGQNITISSHAYDTSLEVLGFARR